MVINEERYTQTIGPFLQEKLGITNLHLVPNGIGLASVFVDGDHNWEGVIYDSPQRIGDDHYNHNVVFVSNTTITHVLFFEVKSKGFIASAFCLVPQKEIKKFFHSDYPIVFFRRKRHSPDSPTAQIFELPKNEIAKMEGVIYG